MASLGGVVGMREPYVEDADFRLFHGDSLDVLRGLPDASVHMCATSPPFYGLRDYGVDGQIGLEVTPEEWCARLVEVFREVRRVLRDDGTFWVEIGDSYCANTRSSKPRDDGHAPQAWNGNQATSIRHPTKQKDLLGQPWLLAFALRADGWYLRSEIIWARPNPMPESVTDRPTKAHSTIFLLSKSARYFYDADALRTPYAYDGRKVTTVVGGDGSAQHRNGERWPGIGKAQAQARRSLIDGGHDESEPMEIVHHGANARTVWTVPTEPTPFAHFATWPQEIVRRMILAGTSEKGCCPECGAPWGRVTETAYDAEGRTTNGPRSTERRHETAGFEQRLVKQTETTGWQAVCICGETDTSPLDGRERAYTPVPCTVLDPFFGSGTTGLVARKHGRHSIGIELSETYCALAADRLQQLSLLAAGAA